MNDRLCLSLPQFGGDGMTVLASNEVVAVDGTHKVSIRLPISTSSSTWSNAGYDSPDQQLVLEIIPETTHGITMRLFLTGRTRPMGKEDKIFCFPDTTEAAQIRMELDKGRLVISARKPNELGDNDTFTLLSLLLKVATKSKA